MTDIGRKRGRPKGTEIATDRAILAKMADLMLREGVMRPTTAIKRVRPDDWNENLLHRLRGKWKQRSRHLMAEARARVARPHKASASRGISALAVAAAGRDPFYDALGLSSRGAVMQAAMGLANETAVLRALREANERCSRLLNEATHGSGLGVLCQMENSPTARAMRLLDESPTMRMMREMENSPTMRAMREIAGHRYLYGPRFGDNF